VRIFLAGATGVIGTRLIPLLVADGHVVAGMTRSAGRAGQVRDLGAEPVICDVYDAAALTAAMTGFRPDVVLHQLTDLPDDASDSPPPRPRIHLDDAARQTVATLGAPPGLTLVADDRAG
jgi:uncharacterized protein YbjT (DUF2867 family)